MRTHHWTIQAHDGQPRHQQTPVPQLMMGDVRVRILCAGLCKTDVFAASGQIPVPFGRVLGHEAVGRVDMDSTGQLNEGQHVIIWPYIACGSCLDCVTAKKCSSPIQVGIDRNGCFAQYIVIPYTALIPVPKSLSLKKAAYTEPLSAALGILMIGLQRNEKIALIGRNRRMHLLEKVLEQAGHQNIVLCSSIPKDGCFDAIVLEALAVEDLPLCVARLKQDGKLLLSNRSSEDISELSLKSKIQIQRLPMGDPKTAIQWLMKPSFDLRHLLGPILPVEHFLDAFQQTNTQKVFYQP